MDGSPLASGFLKLLQSAGWCGHVFDLLCGLKCAAGHDAFRANQVPTKNTHSKCIGQNGFSCFGGSTGFVHQLPSALPNLVGAAACCAYSYAAATIGSR